MGFTLAFCTDRVYQISTRIDRQECAPSLTKTAARGDATCAVAAAASRDERCVEDTTRFRRRRRETLQLARICLSVVRCRHCGETACRGCHGSIFSFMVSCPHQRNLSRRKHIAFACRSVVGQIHFHAAVADDNIVACVLVHLVVQKSVCGVIINRVLEVARTFEHALRQT